MKSEYTQAFLATIQDGVSIDAALSGLRAALDRKGHSKLYTPVLLEALRILETEKGTNQAVVLVAKSSDATSLKSVIQTALKELGATDATTVKEVVDETIIGGFVATYDYKEHDQSYKKSLKNLYESIVK